MDSASRQKDFTLENDVTRTKTATPRSDDPKRTFSIPPFLDGHVSNNGHFSNDEQPWSQAQPRPDSKDTDRGIISVLV